MEKKLRFYKTMALIFMLCLIAVVMAVGVTALAKSMQFSLGTKYAPAVKVKVEMEIDGQYETIFNSANQGEVNYNASYINNVTKDTIFLKQTPSLIENDIINLKFTSFDTTYKINVYINESATPNVLNKATNVNTPVESGVIAVDISGVGEILGLILVSLRFEPIEELTVSFNSQGGSACENITFEKGQTPALPTPTLTGYEFLGWFTSADYTNQITSTSQITASTTLFAKWSVETYTITYKDQGGADFSGVLAQNSPTAHVYEKQTTLLNPTKANHTFQGWFLDSACTGSPITALGATAFTDDITLYAKWQANSTAILLNNQSATTAGTAVIYFKDGDEKYYSNASCTTELTTITNPTKTGYVFEGYYSQINGAGVQYINSDGNIVALLMGLTHNTNLYASWVEVWDGVTIATQFAGGNGSEATPYLISNGEQLAYLAQLVNSGATDTDTALYSTKHYKQTQNIYLNSAKIINGNGGNLISGSYTSWTPIGNDSTFKGTFDGSNKNISGIYISISSSGAGLFGYAQSATFKNINVLNSYIKGNTAGGIVGSNYGGGSNFINCCNYSTISGSAYGGAICGASYNGSKSTFTNCHNYGTAYNRMGLTFGDDIEFCPANTSATIPF